MAVLAKNSRIAVIGGGIGGLTLTNLLQQAGFENVQVFERWAEMKTRGGHISIMPANLGGALHVLEALDLDTKISAFAKTTEGFRSFENGKLLAEHKVSLGPRIMREALQQVLLGRLAEGSLHYGKALRAFEEQDDHVKLHFQDGASEAFDLVVAADGINSAVAEELSSAPKRFTGFVTYVCIARGEHMPDGFYDHHIHGNGHGFTVRGCPGCGVDGRWDMLAFTVRSATPVSSSWESEGTKDEISALLDAIELHADGCPKWMRHLLADAERVMKWGIYDHAPKATWISPAGKVVLLGDAAHAMAPYLGKGAQSAMLDAHVLVQELLARPLPEALLAYEAQRKPSCEAIVQQASFEGLGITSFGVAAAYRTATKAIVGRTIWGLQRRGGWFAKVADLVLAASKLGHHAAELANAFLLKLLLKRPALAQKSA